MTERWVLHADMDAFYASIEQRDRPELRGEPVIVGGTSGRGVVTAASYEARVFGVRSAMPGFRARELCPEGIFIGGDMRKYTRVSAEVHAVFEEFTPVVEPLSLDEAFLDITGATRPFGGPVGLARELKARVLERTGLVVSCGIAANKHVAKIACSSGKPDGLVCVPPRDARAFLAPLPVRRLWGIGPVAERTLVEAGLRTVGDVAEASVKDLAKVVGMERARSLALLALGEDDRPVEAAREAKSYGEENTFERDVKERERVTETLGAHAHAVARRLRKDGFVGRTVTLRVKLGRRRGTRKARIAMTQDEPIYPLLTRSKTLPHPTDDGDVIRRHAIKLWDAARIAEPVRLLGVAVSNLSPSEQDQLDLFDAERQARSKDLGPALDKLRARFGDEIIRVGAEAPEKVTATTRRKKGE